MQKNIGKRIAKAMSAMVGLPMVYIGVAVLAVSYFAADKWVNALLITGLVLVLGGSVGYVVKERRK